MPLTIQDLYEIYLEHERVCTDSRAVQAGDLFIALKGDRYDGNEFAAEALEKGAGKAVIDDLQYEQEGTILVRDTLRTLQQLATHHRDTFDIPVLAITGSNGKTTTKELIGAVLSRGFQLHITSGNLNNHIGLPLTILDMNRETELAVLEMGASAPGEIAALCEIAHPTHGLITNIGAAHIEGFGDLNGVKRAKGELYDYLRKTDGVAFVSEDEPHLSELARGIDRTVSFRQADHPSESDHEYKIGSVLFDPKIVFEICSERSRPLRIESELFGEHNFKNIMAAVAVGRYFEISPSDIKMGIQQYSPSNHRSEWKEIGDNTYLMDCYNANPVSMRAAIDSFRSVDAKHKVLILGDMLELGPISTKEHRDILDYAGTDEWEAICVVGYEFSAVADRRDVHVFETVKELGNWFERQAFEDTYFLLKGSRGIGLEALIDRA